MILAREGEQIPVRSASVASQKQKSFTSILSPTDLACNSTPGGEPWLLRGDNKGAAASAAASAAAAAADWKGEPKLLLRHNSEWGRDRGLCA